MYVRSVRIKNLANISNLSLDLSEFGRSLVAVSGPNSGGKSHLLEAMMTVPLFRRIASYDEPVQDHFTGKGEVDVVFSIGDETFRSVIAGKAGSTPECFLYAGDELIAGPSPREYDAEIAKIIPSRESILMSRFSAQFDSKGIFSASKQVRQNVFSELIGIGSYEKERQLCAERAKELTKEIENYEVVESIVGGSLADLRREVIRIESEIESVLESLRTAKDAEASASKKALASEKEYQEELSNLRSRSDALRSKESDLLAANAKVDAGRKTLETLRCGDFDVEAAKNRVKVQRISLNKLERMDSHYSSIVSTLRPSIKAKLAEAESARRRLDDVVWLKEAQIQHLRDRLAGYAGVDLSNDICRICPLTQNAIQIQPEIAVIESEIREEKERYESAWCGDHHVIEAEVKVLSEASDSLALTKTFITELRKQLKDVEASIASNAKTIQRINEATALVAANQEIVSRLAVEVETLKDDVRKATERVESAKRVKESDASILSEVSLAVSTTQLSLRELESQKVDIERRITQAEKLSESNICVTSAKEDVECYRLLGEFIKEARRREIDSICPEIEEISNAILQKFQDGRFLLRIDTVVPKKSGGEKEYFNPTILDTRTNRLASKVCGGEYAILAESLRTGICMSMVDRSGIQGGTIIRDEATGALDEENAGVYVDILRYGIDSGMFDQVVFVCHQKHVLEKADVVVELKDGQIVKVI